MSERPDLYAPDNKIPPKKIIIIMLAGVLGIYLGNLFFSGSDDDKEIHKKDVLNEKQAIDACSQAYINNDQLMIRKARLDNRWATPSEWGEHTTKSYLVVIEYHFKGESRIRKHSCYVWQLKEDMSIKYRVEHSGV